MKRTLLITLAVLAWLAGAGAAQAIPVTVGTREWLQPIEFVNLSWDEISGVCNSATGNCSANALGAVADMDPWTWAAVDLVNALFNEVIGLPALDGPDVYWGAPESFYPSFESAGFEPTYAGIYPSIAGYTRESSEEGTAIFALVGRFETRDIAQTDLPIYKGSGSGSIGSWFYRERGDPPPPEAAPVPATLPLVGLSLIALGYSRRRRKKHT